MNITYEIWMVGWFLELNVGSDISIKLFKGKQLKTQSSF